MMARFQNRLVALGFAFVMLLIVFLAMPVQANTREMIEKMRKQLEEAHKNAHHQFKVHASIEFVTLDRAKALELAKMKGARYLGSDRPKLGQSSRYAGLVQKTTYGPREEYFYSIARPEDNLDEYMKDWLAPNGGTTRTAVLLWKHIPPTVAPELVSIDIINHTGFDWGNYLKEYGDVIAMAKG
ncbi:uncharacterized protein SPSC_06085 [Sporisorium scitamineum]|uniref:SCP domain-containing protein n=1 Tax=Sporisorium scitamineum TaxID=49012 RepID=A0A127ZIH9_9BASI|nr:uncharacterized protein SPSC_06085 [Sporisorium scitamineum]